MPRDEKVRETLKKNLKNCCHNMILKKREKKQIKTFQNLLLLSG